MESDKSANKEASIKPLLIAIFILELLLLVPWAMFSALGAMAFDSGFSWSAVIIVAPLWSYPILLLIFGIATIVYANLKRQKTALITIISPIAIPIVCYMIIAIYSTIPSKESLEARKVFSNKCELAKEYIYKTPKDINGIYRDYNVIPTRYSKIVNGNLIKWHTGRTDSGKLFDEGIITYFETNNYSQGSSPNGVGRLTYTL